MKEGIKLFIWDNLSEAVDIFPPSVGAKLISLKAKNEKADFFEQLELITELNKTIVSTIENRYLIFIFESDNKLSHFARLLDKEALRDVPYKQRKEYVEAAEKIAAKEADSQELATLLNSIGRIYIDLAEYDKALERHEKALNVCLATVGENHPDTASSYNGIGSVYNNKAEYDKALEYYEKALKIWLVAVGEYHSNVADAYNNIGAVYHSKGEYDNALEYCGKALKIWLVAVGEYHSNVADAYNNIGVVYHSKGEYGKALEYHEKALKIWLVAVGEYHPDTANSHNGIGSVYYSKGEYGKALEHYEKAIKIWLATIGENHPDTASSYNNIGLVYNDKGEPNKALEYCEKALKIWLVAVGEYHSNVASAYNNIGVVYRSKGEYDKALEYYEKALKIRFATTGENHPDTAILYSNIGLVYHRKSNHAEAKAYFEKAFEIVAKTSNGISHPDCERYHNSLAGSTFFVNHENSNIDIKIQKAEIENFKLLSKITIELSKNVNIIIGENSSGKTSLLQAITLGLLRKSDLLDHGNCITKNKNEANIKLTIDKYIKVVKIEKGDREVVSNKVLTPFVLAYGSNIFNGDTSAKNIDEYIENIKNKTMTKGFTGSIFESFSIEFYNPKTILNALWADENTKDIAQTVTEIINRFIENNGLKIENGNGKFYFKHNGQNLFKLDELSEGYRNSVVLLGDILFKVFGIGKTPKSVDGIILIDEFDRHLHPRLQTSLVNKLSDEFPNIQFILTTHNPMAILDRKPDEITVVYEEDGIVKTKKDIGTKYIDVGTALLKYFGVDSLVGESMQKEIERFTELKLKSELEAYEKEELEAIEQKLDNTVAVNFIYNRAYFEFLKFVKENKNIDFNQYEKLSDEEMKQLMDEYKDLF